MDTIPSGQFALFTKIDSLELKITISKVIEVTEEGVAISQLDKRFYDLKYRFACNIVETTSLVSHFSLNVFSRQLLYQLF